MGYLFLSLILTRSKSSSRLLIIGTKIFMDSFLVSLCPSDYRERCIAPSKIRVSSTNKNISITSKSTKIIKIRYLGMPKIKRNVTYQCFYKLILDFWKDFLIALSLYFDFARFIYFLFSKSTPQFLNGSKLARNEVPMGFARVSLSL